MKVSLSEARRHLMLKLRSMGPCTIDELKYELIVQCRGVTKTNVNKVFEATWDAMEKADMFQIYDEDAYEVHERLYNNRGEYIGDE